jgi:hypothetical protein
MDDEMDQLLNAIDNEDNESIMGLTTNKIKGDKNDILQQLQIESASLKIFHKKLKKYRYCEDVQHIRLGYYIRWIPLRGKDCISLTNGGILCEIKNIGGKVHLVCKNNYNKLMQLKFDECIVFQKLSVQELVILDILDYLNK